jgi:hypothetical protein
MEFESGIVVVEARCLQIFYIKRGFIEGDTRF